MVGMLVPESERDNWLTGDVWLPSARNMAPTLVVLFSTFAKHIKRCSQINFYQLNIFFCLYPDPDSELKPSPGNAKKDSNHNIPSLPVIERDIL